MFTIHNKFYIMCINYIIVQRDLSKLITLKNLTPKIVNKVMVSYLYIL